MHLKFSGTTIAKLQSQMGHGYFPHNAYFFVWSVLHVICIVVWCIVLLEEVVWWLCFV
jgi:hypothetical protein